MWQTLRYLIICFLSLTHTPVIQGSFLWNYGSMHFCCSFHHHHWCCKGGQFEGRVTLRCPHPCCCSGRFLPSCHIWIILILQRPNQLWLYGQQGQLCCIWHLMPRAWGTPNLLKAVATWLSQNCFFIIMALKSLPPSVISPGRELLGSTCTSSQPVFTSCPLTRSLEKPKRWWLTLAWDGWCFGHWQLWWSSTCWPLRWIRL